VTCITKLYQAASFNNWNQTGGEAAPLEEFFDPTHLRVRGPEN